MPSVPQVTQKACGYKKKKKRKRVIAEVRRTSVGWETNRRGKVLTNIYFSISTWSPTFSHRAYSQQHGQKQAAERSLRVWGVGSPLIVFLLETIPCELKRKRNYLPQPQISSYLQLVLHHQDWDTEQ